MLRGSGYVLVALKSLDIQSSQWFAGVIRECILERHHPEPELEPAESCKNVPTCLHEGLGSVL